MTTEGRFYADDGELWDYDPTRLQAALTDLEGLFLRMGLRINGNKTKTLLTLPTVATTNISTIAYKQRMNGIGDTYRTRKQRRTICPVCDQAMQMQSIATHYRSQHPMLPIPPMDAPVLLQDQNIDEYTITAHVKKVPIQCPVPSCGITVKGGWYNLRCHFQYRHHGTTITIAEEGYLPPCQLCGFQCEEPHNAHQNSKLCTKGCKFNTRRTYTQQIIQAR